MRGFITHKRDLSLPTYSLGTSLKSVKCVKDLGIMLLYKSLVRPVIEYAAPAWNPYVAKDVLGLERIQRIASRLALGQKRGEMEYEDRSDLHSKHVDCFFL